MKSAALFLAIVVVTFVLGCQHNMTEPIAVPTSGEARLSKPASRGTIPIDITLREPFGFNAYTMVRGQVNYNIEVFVRDPIPPNPEWVVLVTLDVDLKLNPYEYQEPTWRIVNLSRDERPLDYQSDNAVIIKQTHRIPGRTDGVSLYLEFQVDEELVHLRSLSLVPPRHPRVGDDW